uniref:UDP N-acetylglucosamine O-acyltransferase C-terminal domain-containing protein n=1 Tax=Salix viminalis TaxID=40686 RepID=A0A6N2MZX9_SALVM
MQMQMLILIVQTRLTPPQTQTLTSFTPPPTSTLTLSRATGAVVGDHLPGRTVLGRSNVIGHHAVIGVKCQDLKYKVIGDNNLIMGSCHIAHDCKIGNNNIFANSTLLAGHVVVEDYTHTAGAIVVHQFCHIGSFSFVGGGSVVSQDVPKYTMVAGERAELRGLNLEGLRRHEFTATEEEDKELGKIPVVCTMIQSLRDSFAQNRRGICKFRYFSGS